MHIKQNIHLSESRGPSAERLKSENGLAATACSSASVRIADHLPEGADRALRIIGHFPSNCPQPFKFRVGVSQARPVRSSSQSGMGEVPHNWRGMRQPIVKHATVTALTVTYLCAQTLQWKDPSPHRTHFVRVDDGVQLEVLDWGGSGHPLVLLAGSGHSAHIFDDVAVKLTPFSHVYGITRRGYGASSHPDSGYGAQRLGDDVLAVLDSLHIDRPVLAGHSFGGKDLTALASANPNRAAGLIYLDSTADPTFDWGPYMELRKKLPPKMAMGFPKASPEDRRSFQAYREWQMRSLGIAFPESELRNVYATKPDGSMGDYQTPVSVRDAITAGMRKPDYSGIRVPVLAFFTLPASLEKQMERYQPRTAEERAAMKQVFASDLEWARRAIDRMRSDVPAARVVEMPGADHYIFLSNEAEVLLEIRQFVTTLR